MSNDMNLNPCPVWCPAQKHEWETYEGSVERLHTSDLNADAFITQRERNIDGVIGLDAPMVAVDLTNDKLSHLAPTDARVLAAQLVVAADLADEVSIEK